MDIEQIIRSLPGWEDRALVIEAAIPVLASPSWRGVDGAPLVARDTQTGAQLFVKQLHVDTAFYIDADAAFQAARIAGEAGVGPRVLFADAGARVLVSEYLGAGWRTAGLEHAADPGFIDRVLAARAKLAAGPALPARADVFADLQRFAALIADSGAPTAPDLHYAYDTVMLAAERASGDAPVPIHGDGNLSNVLFHTSGEIRLVDYDRAGMGSPCEELGSALVEMCAFEPPARAAFSRAAARFGLPDNDEVFDRIRLCGVADDLRWAMIGMLMGHLSPRKHEEFYKFGLWRMVRLRAALRDPRFGERLRSVA
ncbi:phosphotransferase [Salipiger sp. 1_MG-2023]|uniref:phosphotransferase n=1 Tax=Salipiger sp. 1_MG-2023 TaxID=3062665 RepID=UPI0026E3F65E|nr:phosphotransferase [Salipiger sp. 1_MG-2023]MDO6587423.1 phosphotransferase [Salipiger sp. 1_MG-2023]